MVAAAATSIWIDEALPLAVRRRPRRLVGAGRVRMLQGSLEAAVGVEGGVDTDEALFRLQASLPVPPLLKEQVEALRDFPRKTRLGEAN